MLADFAAAVRDLELIHIWLQRFSFDEETASSISFAGLKGVTDFAPADQVVIARTGTSIAELNEDLEPHGQCIPYKLPVELGGIGDLTLGDAIALNLPHALEGHCGTWRDWVLGMKIVLADGTIAKSGSKVVKSVAGYDVHKLVIGSRYTLGIPVEVTLRTYPLASLPSREVISGTTGGWFHWIQRVKRTDFERAVSVADRHLIAANPSTSTIWAEVPPDRDLPRYADDWVTRSGCGEKNLQFTDPTQIALMRRTKDLFDPAHKLNPGEMGIF